MFKISEFANVGLSRYPYFISNSYSELPSRSAIERAHSIAKSRRESALSIAPLNGNYPIFTADLNFKTFLTLLFLGSASSNDGFVLYTWSTLKSNCLFGKNRVGLMISDTECTLKHICRHHYLRAYGTLETCFKGIGHLAVFIFSIHDSF